MSQKTIAVGTVGTPVSLDTNFSNSQDNFTELYASTALMQATKGKSKARIIDTAWDNMISFDGTTFSIPASLRVVVDKLAEKLTVAQDLTIPAGTQDIFWQYSANTFVVAADGVTTYYLDDDYYYLCTIKNNATAGKETVVGLDVAAYVNPDGTIIGDTRNQFFTYSDPGHASITYTIQPTWTERFRNLKVYTSNPDEVFVLKTFSTDVDGTITHIEIQAWIDGLRVGTFYHLFSGFELLSNGNYYKKAGVVYDSGLHGDAVIEMEIDGTDEVSYGLGGTYDTGIHVARSQIFSNTSNITNSYNLRDYVEGQKAVAKIYGIPCLDLYSFGGINLLNKANYMDGDNLHYNAAGYAKLIQMTTDFIRTNGGFTDYTGKTLGVFGGSFSVDTDSAAMKAYWASELGLTVTDEGVGGNGFSDAIVAGTISDQIDGVVGTYDIYLLWCSTNDLRNVSLGAVVGDPWDSGTTSQAGGMNDAIGKIYTANSLAQILIFTSAKTFDDIKYYDPYKADF